MRFQLPVLPLPFVFPRFRGDAKASKPESRGSGFDASHRPGTTNDAQLSEFEV
jgi:hypothetical protein